jgi:hypothetical protein
MLVMLLTARLKYLYLYYLEKPIQSIISKELKDRLKPNSIEFGRENENQHGLLLTESSTKSVSTEVGNYGQYYSEIALAINTKSPLPVCANEAVQVVKLSN